MMVRGSKSKLMKKACALALGILLAVSQAGLCVLAEPSETYNEVEDEDSENENSEEESEVDKKTEEQNSGTEKDAQSDEEQAAFDMTKSCGDVTILLSAPEGVFPKGAYFEVREVSNSEEKNIDEAISEIRDDSEQVAASYTYDITVYDKDGNEIEPNTEYGQVSVTFSMDEATDSNLEAKVYHIETSEDAFLAEELETSVSGDEVTALTDGFSYYTVEFTYGDKLCYVLNGDEKTELLTILEACGIDADGEITEAVSSNTDLFKGVCEDGVWFIYALKPFHTEETLKVTVDGKVYTIKVTDEVYKYWDPDNMIEVGCPDGYTPVEYTEQTKTTVLEEKKCYFVSGDITVADRIVVNRSEDNGGSTYLILCNGAKLTAEKGIYVGEGKGLYIYAQSPDISAMGALEAVGETDNAGIGGDDGDCGTIAIYGGNITARGGGNAAGIGGGNGGIGTSISINGGKVTAQGGANAAGIGSGNRYGKSQSDGSINIDRGTVIADGGAFGAGIGGGAYGDAGSISIQGGNVTANGGTWGAGIGSGYLGSSDGSITIERGTVDATGGPNAAGIGAGMNAVNCDISIQGGNVTARGGDGGAGIGSGYEGGGSSYATESDIPGEIKITSGTVNAYGSTWGAGIGGGGKSKVGNINITGGEITATGGNTGGAGIGSGREALSSCTVKIDDGEITATGGSGAAGIGKGSGGGSTDVTLNIDRSKFKYISFEDGKVELSQEAEVNPVVQPKDSIESSYRMEQEEAGGEVAPVVTGEPLLKNFSGKGMGGLCTFEKQGPLCAAVFKAATPLGFFEAFSFNLNLDATGKTKPNYGKKTGEFVLNIPEKYRKKGRTFAIIGIDKSGKVKIFYDIDTDDKLFTTELDIEGYAFSLIYTDLAVKKTKNTTLN